MTPELLRLLPGSLRKAESEALYQQAKKDGTLIPLSEEAVIEEWLFWKLIDNRFPYDAVFQVHRMLIPKRVVAEWGDLSTLEKAQFEEIKQQYRDSNEYDLIFENFGKRRSVTAHWHEHLAIYKEDLRQILEGLFT